MIYFALFMISLGLSLAIRSYAKHKSLLDIPNERSSHTVPTPRGGGLAIIITFFLGVLYFTDVVEERLIYALLCVLPIVLISLLDDISPLSSGLRAMVQMFSIALGIYALGGIESIDFISFSLEGFWVNILALISIFWLTNLYNFLDGIDGYAGSQALSAGLGLFVFFANPLGLVLVASALGFLVLNWHRASLFMGDVGSASLGFIFGIFAFYDTSQGNILLWFILLSLFCFDATLTLLRRFLNKEKLTQAHKKHAYQRLVQAGYSHAWVVIASLIFNSFFLGLLYYFENLGSIFIANIIFLSILMFWIERKKAFK